MNIKIKTQLADELCQAESPSEKTDRLFAFMRKHGQSRYDESVTQLEHALQAAMLAKAHGARESLVVGALLHDIGHFLTDEADAESDFTQEDWFHEDIGAELLKPFLPSAAIEPIRLHVAAKRYLCSVDPQYAASLSQASQRSLQLQGGPMTAEQQRQFEENIGYEDALLVRRWDDGAKLENYDAPDLESYRREVEICFAAVNSDAS